MFLKDHNSYGKDRKWKERKIQSTELADSLAKLHYNKNIVNNVYGCSNVLVFSKVEGGTLRLKQAWFCKNKLCPICNWRRSKKYSYQTSRIINKALEEYPKASFLFLTLTKKNVLGSELSDEITQMNKDFAKMMRKSAIKKSVIGYVKSVEVTTEKKRKGYYHPHIHVLIMVKSTYFSGSNYIKKKDWVNYWMQASNLDYVPQVDIRKVESKNDSVEVEDLRKAILETAKYPFKPIKISEENLMQISHLAEGLANKRQVSFCGLFKAIKKELELDDAENGDLLNTGDANNDNNKGLDITAVWDYQRKNYYLQK